MGRGRCWIYDSIRREHRQRPRHAGGGAGVGTDGQRTSTSILSSCDFLVTARWDVRLCVYDGAVCGGVYPGALGATQCVYEHGGRGTVCGIDSTLVLRLRAGLWASESRVPSSAPSLQSLLVPEAESSIQPSPRFRPHGTDPLVIPLSPTPPDKHTTFLREQTSDRQSHGQTPISP